MTTTMTAEAEAPRTTRPATGAAHPPTPPSLPPLEDWSYRAVWRRLPRGLGYLVPTFAIAITVSAILNSLFSAGVSLLIVVVGLFLIALTLLLARFAGSFEVLRLRWSGERAIAEPDWRIDPSQPLWRKALTPFANGHYWLSLLHGAIIAPIVATVSFVLLTVWGSFILAGVIAPIAWAVGGRRFVGPDLMGIVDRIGDGGGFGPGYWIWMERFGGPLRDQGLYFPLELNGVMAVLAIALAIGAILTLPYLVRSMAWLHAAIARPLLGRFKSEELEGQVSSLFTARSAAVAAEGSALSRIERDIHDGPQQRLIRLQMDLAAAERRLDEQPDDAKNLIADARRQAQDALDELRNLSRGFAPPLLLDRGLFAALESLATRSSIPVTMQSTLGATADLPDEVARNAYFVASELIANATKHSQATSVTLVVAREGGDLVIAVTDDGVGGAAETPHHGLAGLRDRAVSLGGTFTLSSPDGGPTEVRVTLPLSGVGGAGSAGGSGGAAGSSSASTASGDDA
jgi:signal transduction histidine kinase